MSRGRSLAGVLLRVALVVAVALAAIPAPAAKPKHAPEAPSCSANYSAAGLKITCMNGTLADLLRALHLTVGLQAEYPQELGATPVSVRLRGRSLHEALQSALPAFNFALWEEQGSPPRLMIVGKRGTNEERTPATALSQPAVALEEPPSVPGPLPPADSAAALMPLNDEAEMARVRESFARSLTTGSGAQDWK
jgi:hypothetical protein